MVSDWSRSLALTGAGFKEKEYDVAETDIRPIKASRKKGAALKAAKTRSKNKLEKLRCQAENRSK